MFGKLSWSVIPFGQPIPLVTGAVVLVVILAVLLWVVLKGHMPYLWREWITSVDHKRIGVMYALLACVMLLRGFADAIMMRAQLAMAYHSPGFLPPEHYNQIFSAHGTIMIFFVAMPFVIGLMNLVVPPCNSAFATWRSRRSIRSASGSPRPARCWSTFPWSSASSRAPAGCHTRRCRN
jgi:cytochrome o ubiquinol oxidase subunit I